MKKLTLLLLLPLLMLIFVSYANAQSQNRRNIDGREAHKERPTHNKVSSDRSILDLPLGTDMMALEKMLPQYGCEIVKRDMDAITASSNDVWGSKVSFVGLFPGDDPSKYAICFISLDKDGAKLFPQVDAWVRSHKAVDENGDAIIKNSSWEWMLKDLLVYMYDSPDKRAALTIVDPHLATQFMSRFKR